MGRGNHCGSRGVLGSKEGGANIVVDHRSSADFHFHFGVWWNWSLDFWRADSAEKGGGRMAGKRSTKLTNKVLRR